MASTRTVTTTSTAPLLLALLLLLVAAATTPFATAAANSPIPPACLREAAALCQGSSTNAMACLVKLAAAGDARVSKTCGAALDATTKAATSAKEQQRLADSRSRVHQLARLLNEGCTATGTASNVFAFDNVGNTGTITCGQVCCNAAGSANNACCAHSGSNVVCAATSVVGCQN